MTNASSDGTNNVFYLSRHRVVFYTIGVFLLSAFVALWAVCLMVGRIWEISGAEIAAVFCIAAGVSVIFFIFFKLTEVKPMIAVTESGLAFRTRKKTSFLRFADIVSVREHESMLGKLVRTCKIVIETHLGSFAVYLAADDVRAFFALFPDAEEKEDAGRQTGADGPALAQNGLSPEHEKIVPGKERYICFLSYFTDLTLVLAAVAAVTYPSVAVLLATFSKSRYYLFALLALYGIALLAGFGRYVYLAARFARYSVVVEKDRYVISFGRVAKTEYSLFFDSVLAVRLRRGLIDRLFGLCRISMESRQKAVGISDNNYFPFLLKTEYAKTLVQAVAALPENVSEVSVRPGRCVLIAYAEYAVWFAAAAVIMGIFLTPWMLLLLLVPAAALLPVYRYGAYYLGEEIAAFRFGVFAENTVFVRYEDIRSVTSSQNISASRCGIAEVDVTVGRYTRVFSVGYVREADFAELAEKLEKKVDKD